MASTRQGRAASTTGVTEDDKVQWWLRFNNGVVPVVDGDDKEEEEEEGEEEEGAERRATHAVAGYEEDHWAELQLGPGDDGRAETVARGVKAAEMVARGGGKAEKEEAAGAGGKRRSSPRFADPPAALDAEISGGNNNNYLLPAELPRRRKKAIAKRTKLNVDGTEVQNNISQAQSLPPVVLKGPEWVYVENANLKLQLKQEEIRSLKLELIIKSKETESLEKQIEDLKAENEQLRKNAKPERVKRKCRSCGMLAMHDYRNCPKRREAASSPEEEDGEDSY